MQDAKRTLTDSQRRGEGYLGAKRSSDSLRLHITAIALALASAAGAARATGGSDGPAQAGNGEAIAQMYPTAVVTADRITLGDLAELRGEAAELAAAWPIAQAPKVGTSRVIDLHHVQKVLARRGVNLGHWVFRGNTRCTVRRPSRSAPDCTDLPGCTARAPADRDRDPVGPGAAGPAPIRAGIPDIDPDSLGGVLHEHIRHRLAHIGGVPLVEFPPQVMRLCGLSKPTYAFHVESRSDRLLGVVPLSVTIYEKDRVKQVLRVLARVSLRKPVLVAARPINRGQTIDPGDLTVEDRVFERIGDIGLTDAEPLIGQRAAGFIKEGEQIGARDIEPVPLIRRNDLVTVVVRRGNLMIKGSARALSSGGYGDVVELKNEMARRSAETYTAVVTGRKTAEVPGPVRDPAAAPALAKGAS